MTIIYCNMRPGRPGRYAGSGSGTRSGAILLVHLSTLFRVFISSGRHLLAMSMSELTGRYSHIRDSSKYHKDSIKEPHVG